MTSHDFQPPRDRVAPGYSQLDGFRASAATDQRDSSTALLASAPAVAMLPTCLACAFWAERVSLVLAAGSHPALSPFIVTLIVGLDGGCEQACTTRVYDHGSSGSRACDGVGKQGEAARHLPRSRPGQSHLAGETERSAPANQRPERRRNEEEKAQDVRSSTPLA